MRNRRLASLMARLVPPRREIILRSGGHVRYFGVGRFGQISVMVLAALLVGWIGFASARYVSNALVVAERNVRIATSDRIIRNMQEEIDELQADLARRSQTIDQKDTAHDELEGRNVSLQRRIANLESERDRLFQVRNARDREIARLNDELMNSQDDREGVARQLGEERQRLEAHQAERQQLAANIDNASKEISQLNGKIGQLNRERNGLVSELQAAQNALAAAADEREQTVAERQKLNERVAILSDRLELFEASQSESINRLGESANNGITALERTLVVAGLDIPLMLERVLGERAELAEGVGGPFLALEDEPGSEAGEKLAEVEQRLLRLQGLQGLMKHLPLAAPMDEFRLSSGFGRRRDPFTNRLAMHPGLDFASRKKIPVYVTSPGRVAFVGWKGGYGKVVEVDHGLGIRTRYAHLSRIFVKRGQTLEFREKVGLVGSTGRSTSTHLHYEIMVDGQQLDPANFLRAGQYVFKN